MYSVFVFCVSQLFFFVLSLLCCIVFIVCMNMMLSYMEEIKNLSIYLSGRDCTNNNELLHKIGVLQCYVMQLFVITRELLQAIRWRSKYNGCTQRI